MLPVISILILFCVSSILADNHLPVNIPPGMIQVYETSGGSDKDEWEYDKKILESLGEIMQLFEDKWSNKISQELEEKPINPPYLKCPKAWPFHDAWPVAEPLCDLDSECEEGKLCCLLFLKHYCLKGVDSRPKPGECPLPEPTTVPYQNSCHLDEVGCFYDSECEDDRKCCPGACDYKECAKPIENHEPAETQAEEVTESRVFGRSGIARRRRLLNSRRTTDTP